RTTVYNVEVEDFHTYFVGEGGVWVHNACGGPQGGGKGATVPNGKAVKVERHPEGLTSRSRPMGPEEARRQVNRGQDMFAGDRATAADIAGRRSVGPEKHPAAGENRFGHF